MTTNADLVREYLAWQRDTRRRSSLTVYSYAGVLSKLVDHCADTPLGDVRTAQLEDWLERPRARRAKGSTAQAATLAKEVAIVRSLFRYLTARGHVGRNPADLLVPPAVHNVNPKPVPDEVWRTLWLSDLTDDARVALGLGYYCGLRRREVVSLAPHQVSTIGRQLVGFTRKGGGDDVLDYGALAEVYAKFLPHLMPEPEQFLRSIERLCGARIGKPCLLPWGEEVSLTNRARRIHGLPDGACDPQAFNRKVQRWLREAGLSASAITPHSLRHSFVTNLLRAGVALPLVSRLAAHTNVSTTMRYARVGRSELRDWLHDNKAVRVTPSEYQRHHNR